MRFCSLLVALALAACTSPRPTVTDAAILPSIDATPVPVRRVLFIGNSYVSYHDLPTVLARLSQAPQSPVRFVVASHAPGSQTWEDHDANPAVDALIAEGWDHVVLQDQSQQPWTVPGVKPELLSLDAKIEAAGAETVLYMTWARWLDPLAGSELEWLRQEMTVNRYYQQGGDTIGAAVAPAGRAWERALRDPTLALHDTDGSHPNPRGAYLTACVLYATLTGESPVGLGDAGFQFPAEVTARLQEVAWETIEARRAAAAPLLGEWPLAASTDGNDLVAARRLVLGDEVGPDGAPGSATRFGPDRLATIPYFTAINSPHVTVAFHAYRADWSVPANQHLVGKWRGYELALGTATGPTTGLRARLFTTADAAPAPELLVDLAGLTAGWHHLAFTYDGAIYQLWVDGVAAASGTATGDIRYYVNTPGSFESTNGIAIGAPAGPSPESVFVAQPLRFTGALAGLQLYGEALDVAELKP